MKFKFFESWINESKKIALAPEYFSEYFDTSNNYVSRDDYEETFTVIKQLHDKHPKEYELFCKIVLFFIGLSLKNKNSDFAIWALIHKENGMETVMHNNRKTGQKSNLNKIQIINIEIKFKDDHLYYGDRLCFRFHGNYSRSVENFTYEIEDDTDNEYYTSMLELKEDIETDLYENDIAFFKECMNGQYSTIGEVKNKFRGRIQGNKFNV